MTKHELIDGFIRGHIGRRDFIRGLTALGVSASAATAYAVSLGPAVSAAGIRDKAGYRLRAQQDDDYGGPPIEEIIELLREVIRILQVLARILGRIFGPNNPGNAKIALFQSTLSDTDLEALTTLVAQQTEHAEALRSALPELSSQIEGEIDPDAIDTNTPEETIAMVQPLVSVLPGVYATILPGLADNAAITTVTSIALVASRHAAFINRLAGEPEFPETFQREASASDVQTLTESLG